MSHSLCKTLLGFIGLLALLCLPAWTSAKTYLIVLDEDIYKTPNPAGEQTGMPLPVISTLTSLFNAEVDVKTIDVKPGSNSFTRYFIKKYDLVIAVGYNTGERAYNSALNNRSQKYALLGSYRTRPPENVTAVHFNTGEAAFVAGYIAARFSKTKYIGFMASEENLPTMDILRGFKDGAQLGDPKVVVRTKIINKPYDIRNQTSIMYSSMVDIIFQASDFYGPEGLTTAQYARKWYMGLNLDLYDIDTTYVLASVVADYNRAILEVVTLMENDALPGGEVIKMQLANDGVSLALLDNVPPEIMESTLQVIENIITTVVKVRNNKNKIINR